MHFPKLPINNNDVASGKGISNNEYLIGIFRNYLFRLNLLPTPRPTSRGERLHRVSARLLWRHLEAMALVCCFTGRHGEGRSTSTDTTVAAAHGATNAATCRCSIFGKDGLPSPPCQPTEHVSDVYSGKCRDRYRKNLIKTVTTLNLHKMQNKLC